MCGGLCFNYTCILHMEVLSPEERELCGSYQVDFHAPTSYSFTHKQKDTLYIASFSPIGQLYLDFLTKVKKTAVFMHCSLKYSASKENSTKSGLNTKTMSTEKMGFGVGWILYCVTTTQILSISPLCQHKVASSFGCSKVGVIVRAIAFLFMSLWGEGNVALGGDEEISQKTLENSS